MYHIGRVLCRTMFRHDIANASSWRVFPLPESLCRCDEKALVDEREAHFTWVEEHGVYDIQPRNGAIAPGDFLHVRPLAPINVTF